MIVVAPKPEPQGEGGGGNEHVEQLLRWADEVSTSPARVSPSGGDR